jgi:hypothetical protein
MDMDERIIYSLFICGYNRAVSNLRTSNQMLLRGMAELILLKRLGFPIFCCFHAWLCNKKLVANVSRDAARIVMIAYLKNLKRGQVSQIRDAGCIKW